jgi:hypothetical protein
MIMRKWLILYSQSRQHNQLELRTLAIADRIEDCHVILKNIEGYYCRNGNYKLIDC